MSSKRTRYTPSIPDFDGTDESPVVESEAPVTEEVTAEIKPVEVAPVLEPANVVALRVYITLCGQKWDQMAGFVSHARRLALGPMTVEAWRAEYQKFQSKPVG
jgi:hypothetical protein